MSLYQHITHPGTKQSISIHSNKAKTLLNQYLYLLGGSNVHITISLPDSSEKHYTLPSISTIKDLESNLRKDTHYKHFFLIFDGELINRYTKDTLQSILDKYELENDLQLYLIATEYPRPEDIVAPFPKFPPPLIRQNARYEQILNGMSEPIDEEDRKGVENYKKNKLNKYKQHFKTRDPHYYQYLIDKENIHHSKNTWNQ